MSRTGEVWESQKRVLLVLEESDYRAGKGDVCVVVVILDSGCPRAVGGIYHAWLPRKSTWKWKRIA